MRFHVIGDSVRCTNCLTNDEPTLFPSVPWDEYEILNPCPYCRGKLERVEYLVDLSEHSGNGCCSCPNFQIRLQPLLKELAYLTDKQAREEVSKGRRLCRHLIMARRFFLDEIIHKLSAGELKGMR